MLNRNVFIILIGVALIAAQTSIFIWLPVNDITSGEVKEIIDWTVPAFGMYAGVSDGFANMTLLGVRDVFYMNFMGSSVYKFNADVSVYDYLFQQSNVFIHIVIK